MVHWIYERYYELAKSIRNGRTLKTDAWQEVNNLKPIEADVYLEILPDVVEKAQAKGYGVVQGSITNIPFIDNSFDTIIDTSTIDHVEDYSSVLKEYSRVLKPNGNILITVWTTDLETSKETENDAAGGTQYIFNVKDFLSQLDNYFVTKECGTLWEYKPHKTLRYFIAYKF